MGSGATLLERFAGTVEPLGAIEAAPVAAWISAIPFDDWPQQHRRADLPMRPAMVSAPDWHGFGEARAPVVATVLGLFPAGCVADTFLLSVVMPGAAIEPHTDAQPPHWLCRVHVPLTSNPESRFCVGGVAHHLRPGFAYRVNTEALHSVENAGPTPRIHFMFDVKRAR